jgi:16S rRNA (adenine1518-N6/adenine1519-N6)-dimethyltransferase
VVRLTVAPRFDELHVAPREFIVFLKTAFAMKRKTLVNNLRKKYADDAIQSALGLSGVPADARAETLSLEQMAQIYRTLSR